MTIRFVCVCGKHLRAREELALRRTQCPACGAPVGIPPLQPTHRGVPAGTLSPAERHLARLRSGQTPPYRKKMGAASNAADLSSTPPIQRESPPSAAAKPEPERMSSRAFGPVVFHRDGPYKAERRQLEAHWYQSLLYPFRAWRLILVLSWGMTFLTGGTALGLPRLIELRTEFAGILLYCFPLVLIPLLILGYTGGYLESVLISSIGGHTAPVRQPARDMGLALRSLGIWFVCFLAGPIVPAGVAFLHWLYSADFTWVDGVIVAELSIAAAGSWWLTVAAACQKEGIFEANPLGVAKLVLRLGGRALFLAGVTAALILALGRLALAALEELHRDAGKGWLLLAVSYLGALYLSTFLFRVLGVWCYRSRLRCEPAE